MFCPRCNSSMIKRYAKQGKHRGSFFWGCCRFPRCRGIVEYNEYINDHIPTSDNLFKRLGLLEDSTIEEAIYAYKKLTKFYNKHPNTDKFNLITNAYNILSDTNKRYEYRKNLKNSETIIDPIIEEKPKPEATKIAVIIIIVILVILLVIPFFSNKRRHRHSSIYSGNSINSGNSTGSVNTIGSGDLTNYDNSITSVSSTNSDNSINSVSSTSSDNSITPISSTNSASSTSYVNSTVSENSLKNTTAHSLNIGKEQYPQDIDRFVKLNSGHYATKFGYISANNEQILFNDKKILKLTSPTVIYQKEFESNEFIVFGGDYASHFFSLAFIDVSKNGVKFTKTFEVIDVKNVLITNSCISIDFYTLRMYDDNDYYQFTYCNDTGEIKNDWLKHVKPESFYKNKYSTYSSNKIINIAKKDGCFDEEKQLLQASYACYNHGYRYCFMYDSQEQRESDRYSTILEKSCKL